jgi:Fe-S-cluster-containing dehydrogenase component
MNSHDETHGITEEILDMAAEGPAVSRRTALKICGTVVVGIASWNCLGMGSSSGAPLLITEKATGLVIADPTRCVACRRCELACTEYNDGKAHPAISRIKVWRNTNFGASGLSRGLHGHGNWGSGLIIQDLCRQCAHPVPCADACPHHAIVVNPPANARVVDPLQCTGCRVCLKACPWEMISYDPDTAKATKCFLCDGKPECVEACPSGALSYVPWIDLSNRIPPRVAPVSGRNAVCTECH